MRPRGRGEPQLLTQNQALTSIYLSRLLLETSGEQRGSKDLQGEALEVSGLKDRVWSCVLSQERSAHPVLVRGARQLGVP